MPYRVEALIERRTLVLELLGPVTVEDRAASLLEILRALDETGFKRILVDFRQGLSVPPSFEAANRHATNLARMYGSLVGARIAYVSQPEQRDATPIETLAAARGFFYQRFTDIEKAQSWLEGT